jgi:hypothetical protein
MTARPARKGRRNKWGNVPTVVDGIRFASKAEAKRYGELKLAERAGEIVNLRRQPRFALTVDGQKYATYVGDFAYQEGRKPRLVVEDVKGVETATFKLKWKLAKALYPAIDWRVIPA